MNFKQFLKDKLLSIILYLIPIIIIEGIFIYKNIELFYIIFIPVILFIFGLIILFSDFNKKRKFYNDLLNKINSSPIPYKVIKEAPYPKFFDGSALIDASRYCCDALYADINICDKKAFNLRDFVMFIFQNKYEILFKSKISTAIKNLEIDINEDEILLYFYIDSILQYILMNNSEKCFIKCFSENKNNNYLFIIETNIDLSEYNYYILLIKKLAKSMGNSLEINTENNLKFILTVK